MPIHNRKSKIENRDAQELNELGRFEEALQAAQRALEANAESADTRFARGFALMMLQRPREALEAIDALVAADPTYPNAAWLRAGLLRQMRGDLDTTVREAFELAAGVEPANLYLRVECADILRAHGHYDQARDLYAGVSAAAVDEPLLVEAIFKLGCVALVLQDTPAAIEAFQTVLDIAPDYPDAREMYEMIRIEG